MDEPEEKPKNIEDYLSDIEKVLPPVVFRNWKNWKHVLPMSPGTVANDDCVGLGPKEKIYMGRVAGYPRKAFVDYLRTKSRMAGYQRKTKRRVA